MAYNHGIRIQENPTSVPAPVLADNGVPVIFGTAPVNLAADPATAANKLFYCETFADAKAALGYSDDYANYTLCQAMDAFFKMFGIGPVVFCNVLDPATHKKDYTESLDVVSNQAITTHKGVILSSLTVKNGSTPLEEDTDYTAEFTDEGYILFTLLTSGVTALAVEGSELDPSKVTDASIIGSYDSDTGVETGIELVREVYPMFSVVPGLLAAPGWSKSASVALALSAKCKNINGAFTCECVVDIDTTSATKYTDVEQIKNDNGYVSEHMICVWPMVKYSGKVMAFSAAYAALVAYADYNNGSVPNLSPSNMNLGISAVVLEDGTEVLLDTVQANVLNAIGVVTAVNIGGVFKSWGNNTAAYPGVTDPKDRWICCRRFFSWWGNSFITTYFEKVDSPANYRLIESIVDSENVRGNALVSEGKCAGIKMEYNASDNPITNVLDGKIVFKQYLAPYTPAEDILNVLEMDVSMIESALGGK